eukprot:scaffold1393_cov343-Prasinococcus_capsulatus_cf.AAC.2
MYRRTYLYGWSTRKSNLTPHAALAHVRPFQCHRPLLPSQRTRPPRQGHVSPQAGQHGALQRKDMLFAAFHLAWVLQRVKGFLGILTVANLDCSSDHLLQRLWGLLDLARQE